MHDYDYQKYRSEYLPIQKKENAEVHKTIPPLIFHSTQKRQEASPKQADWVPPRAKEESINLEFFRSLER